MKFLAVILVAAAALFALNACRTSTPDRVVQLAGLVDSAWSAARAG